MKEKLIIKLSLCLSLLILISFLSSCSITPGGGGGDGGSSGKTSDYKWLIMVYLDGDNSLEANAIDDFNEMERGYYTLKQNFPGNGSKIVVYIDRAAGGVNTAIDGTGDWTGARFYEIMQDSDSSGTGTFTSTRITTTGLPSEPNMSDPATLTAFLNYCKANYTGYDFYSLVIWNHGSGYSVCEDAASGSAVMYLNEVADAIAAAGYSSANKLDVVHMDVCLQGNIETAYALKDYAKYMAFSPASENGEGSDYINFIGNLNSYDSPLLYVRGVVKTYKDYYLMDPSQTQIAVDLSQISTLKTRIDSLANALQSVPRVNFEAAISAATDYDGSSSDDYYVEIYGICNYIISNPGSFNPTAVTRANDVLSTLNNVVVSAYAGALFGGYYYHADYSKSGLFIMYPEYTAYPAFNNWYKLPASSGYIDFATVGSTVGTVETWKELMECYYTGAGY